MELRKLWFLFLIFFLLLSSCLDVPPANISSSGEIQSTASAEEIQTGKREKEILFPQPVNHGRISLEEALASRRSLRSFKEKELDWSQVGQLLWAAQGITSPDGKRTAPSAGALYPLEVYYFCSQFWGRYLPQEHSLEILEKEDKREEIARASFNQSWITQAPGVFVIVGFVERTAVKYGERAERYVILEAGHACQNLLLEAVSLGLGGTSVGAFWDDRIKEILSVEALPLYVIPVGYPKE